MKLRLEDKSDIARKVGGSRIIRILPEEKKAQVMRSICEELGKAGFAKRFAASQVKCIMAGAESCLHGEQKNFIGAIGEYMQAARLAKKHGLDGFVKSSVEEALKAALELQCLHYVSCGRVNCDHFALQSHVCHAEFGTSERDTRDAIKKVITYLMTKWAPIARDDVPESMPEPPGSRDYSDHYWGESTKYSPLNYLFKLGDITEAEKRECAETAITTCIRNNDLDQARAIARKFDMKSYVEILHALAEIRE
jgi:hypothetical protein